VGGRRWRSVQCLCEATRQPTMWCDDDVGVPRQRRAVVSNVDIDEIVRIMMDKTIVFDVANDDLRTAASSCHANNVDLHHPLHPLVDAWEYIVGLTMYGKRDGTRAVRGVGEALTRTTTKTKTFLDEGDVRITLRRSPNNNQPSRARGGGGQPQHRGGGGLPGAPGEGEGRQVGGFFLPVRDCRCTNGDGRGAGGPCIAHPCPGNAKREGR
jgi:hypothetical protein